MGIKLNQLKDPKLRERIIKYIRHVDSSQAGLPDTQQREQPETLARRDEGKTQGTGCPFIRFTLCRVRLLDVDAKYASCKDLIDGCQQAGLIHSDQEGQLQLEVNQMKVTHFLDEHTDIEIIYP